MTSKIKLLALSALITFASGCSKPKAKQLDISTASKKKIIATHAFDVDTQIQALSFVPNDVAPWLGRVIYIGAEGKAYSTDIEGRDPKPVGTAPYSDVFGLMQVKKPGVFLALNNHSGSLTAFIESDNEGRFEQMTTSGANAATAKAFCQTMEPQTNKLMLLTSDGAIVTLNVTVTDTVAEITEISRIKAPKGTVQCVSNADTAFVLSSAKNVYSLNVLKDGKWESHELDFIPNGLASVTVSGIHSLALLGDEGVLLMDASDMNARYHLTIADGLSIRGAAAANFTSSTSAPFGGAAFNEGVIVLSDTSTPRLVFISLGYMSDRLTAVQ